MCVCKFFSQGIVHKVEMICSSQQVTLVISTSVLYGIQVIQQEVLICHVFWMIEVFRSASEMQLCFWPIYMWIWSPYCHHSLRSNVLLIIACRCVLQLLCIVFLLFCPSPHILCVHANSLCKAYSWNRSIGDD